MRGRPTRRRQAPGEGTSASALLNCHRLSPAAFVAAISDIPVTAEWTIASSDRAANEVPCRKAVQAMFRYAWHRPPRAPSQLPPVVAALTTLTAVRAIFPLSP